MAKYGKVNMRTSGIDHQSCHLNNTGHIHERHQTFSAKGKLNENIFY